MNARFGSHEQLPAPIGIAYCERLFLFRGIPGPGFSFALMVKGGLKGLGFDNMKLIFLCMGLLLFFANIGTAQSSISSASGLASWYGEEHRGKLMANGEPFRPEKLTAASWFYPLGTKVRVSTKSAAGVSRSVLVSVTDRGPARDLVRDGRIIDLSHAAFSKLALPGSGLVAVSVLPFGQ